jgi:tRNA threonylcarbamoyladenosine biosynthesis protein TsaE
MSVLQKEERHLFSTEETVSFGKEMALLLRPGSILALVGDLGAGKTTFVQGLAQGLGIEDSVQSPTFVTLNIYEGSMPLFHFDLYRLKQSSDFLSLGFEEYFSKGGICAIEWPERISSLIPADALCLSLTHTESGGRRATLSKWGERC